MAEYYYFVASLPSVWMDKEAPITYKEFMRQAKEQMSKKDYRDLELVSFSPEEGTASSKIAREWYSFSYTLSEMITEERARRLGLENKEYKARCEKNKAIEDKVRKLVDNPNPLEAEKEILSLYFDFLDKHPVASPFSTEALMIYGLKLQIKEKVKGFKRDKGRAEFDRLFENIQKEIFHKE